MKILLIDHAKSDFRNQDHGRWHFIPFHLEKKGHKIKHLTKNDWKYFLLYYSSFKPDVIISTGFAGLIPIIFKKLRLIKCPLVHDWNDYYSEIFSKKMSFSKASFLENFIIENSDFVSTPSKYLKEKASFMNKDCKFISHGVDIDLTKKKVDLKGKLKLLYIGEQTPYKKIDRILNAIKGINCKLYLLGKTNQDLKNKSPKNAVFLGKVPHKEVGSYIQAADICVITADQENLKLHEYAKAKKPILAYNGRINYFLTHLKTAYLTSDFKKGLKELIKNPKIVANLKKDIKEFPTFSWKEIGDKYHKFLIKLSKDERKV